jgi:hypothetical protein
MSDGLITIGSYGTLFEANVVKSELEAFGVDALLENAHTIGVYWLWSNLMGGVKVRVPEGQLAEARRILETEADDPPDEPEMP